MNPIGKSLFIYSFLASIIIHVFALGGGAFFSVSEQDNERTIITEIVTTEIKEKLDQSDKDDKDSETLEKEKEEEKKAVQDNDNDSDLSENTREKETGSQNRKQSLTKGKTSHDKVLKVNERDVGVKKVLKSVKSRIDPLWKQSNPPSKGRVLLKLAIDAEGRAAVLNGQSLQKSELGIYIYRLVRRAAPFKSAMEHRNEPIQIECVFSIED